MASHIIEPERRTLHGHFSRDLTPILEIESGDTVQYRTLGADWHSIPGVKFEPRDPVLDKGHALCGPILIKGAKPGMALEVHIDRIIPAPFGYTVAGGWANETNDWLGVGEGTEQLLLQ